MAKYKAYPEYKDSGVEWLKAIPEHWKISKLRYQFVFDKGLTITKEHLQDEGIPCVNYGEVHSKYGFEVDPEIHTLKCVSDKYLKDNSSSLLAKGDIVFADTSEDIDGSGNFTQLVTDTVTFAGYHTIIARPFERENSRFYAYLLDCKELRSQVRHAVKGVKVFSITQAILRNLSIWLPSKDEQAKIAAFLDHETAKIDKLIEKQQQLIELLKEKRQAVISHAVTKGLNPDVPMKDSGVEWLGEIPQHWGVTRLKYECRNIVDCPHSTPNYTDEGEYPAIRTADILAGYLDLENCRRVTEPVYDERNFRLIPKAGDIIYSREGERFGIGAPIPEGAKVCLAQRVMLFRAKSTPGYLMWALNSSSTYTQAQQDCIGSTSPHVNVDTIKNFILAWPPENEREEISNFIHQTLDSVESLTAHLTEKLTLLQERRTALISAAVTGKIDVRDWVAPDTQDVEEPQEATA
ncbi:TPA: restriction endonuclease subunit S [Klebsiella variicola]|uniref:restriction endonuclease subunit S n=1 Tax=Klebsiella sp. Ap-874 TaxID=2608352 RepID=UPI00141A1038|nr:restriction endonuclease subunit S [Klebsiella sp. Ap-874]EKV8773721.1 restriction endonuclease subunit S [Klebsiella variicola]NIG80734.1 restriction endonuclease subunit S [Klebsiella sp. Ap-873]HED2158119.1 restriction endonuclease subunit S [Klebsiella variicola subsp. variicola]EKW0521252.1 restriction endonuclease subunit S [Klebsiella variicola]NIG51158.1 restriction endonuclease subunit S [Klebsiella sp. Ap-874]